MFSNLAKIISLSVLVLLGSVGVYFYQEHFKSSREIHRLETQKRELEQVIDRLTAETRLADVLVMDQEEVNGVLHTTLLFQEYAKDGSALPPKQFTIEGKTAHIDAMVIKFDRGFVKEGDKFRGKSIALFTKIFGDRQMPENGLRIDEPGKIPEFYRGADPYVSAFEQELWDNFWKLADNEAYRKEKGVRLAQGEGLWREFEMDTLYTITIESDGGLNLTSEPVKGIYQAALKRRQNPS